MIRSSSFTQAVPLASAFAAKGQMLAAIPGTLLSDLVKHSFTPNVGYSAPPAEMGNMVECYTSDNLDGGIHPHTLAVGNSVDGIAGLVLAHVSFTKTVVKPLVQELASELQAAKESLKANAPGSDFSVVSLYVPEILKDASFLDTLRTFKDKAAPDVKKSLQLSRKSNEEVRALMITGSARQDEKIGMWLSRQEPNFAIHVWEHFFMAPEDRTVSGGLYLEAMNNYKQLDYLLGAFLILSRITSEVQETNMTLKAYENLVADMEYKTGVELVVKLDQIYTGMKLRKMIVESSTAQKCIKVDGELYDAWLETGGNPEVILGVLVSNDNTVRSVETIDAKADIFRKKWSSYLMFLNTKNGNDFYIRFKKLIGVAFAKQMLEQSKSEEEINLTNLERVAQITKIADTYVDELNDEELNDVHCIALKLVAKFRFGHTSSYQILCDMEDAVRANPKIDIREAALLATVYYLADYLADQVAIKR